MTRIWGYESWFATHIPFHFSTGESFTDSTDGKTWQRHVKG